ncbi:MAG: hypothetical protein EGR83_10185 [Bacteroides cellulosilyticus]|nr:hypothetical protein [Bacteroides cellulosilyticus]
MIKIIFGLLVWLLLPAFINTRIKKRPIKKAIAKICTILGFIFLILGTYDVLLKLLS